MVADRAKVTMTALCLCSSAAAAEPVAVSQLQLQLKFLLPEMCLLRGPRGGPQKNF